MNLDWIKDTEKIYIFADAIKKGATISCACGKARIPTSWYYEVVDLAESGKNKEAVKFMELIRASESTFELDNLDIIKRHADKDWKAAAWLLERRRREAYALQQNVNLALPEKIVVNQDVEKGD